MANAIYVAREFIRLSLSGEEPDPLTLSRVEKLLYYTQAWSLVIRESEVFEDDLEASPLGPVVPSVHGELLGSDVPGSAFLSGGTEASVFEGELGDFLCRVWESYKHFSATRLLEMTRADPPCCPASGDGAANSLISMNELEDYFATCAIPAPLAVYLHQSRRAEEAAREYLRNAPPLDAEGLRAVAKSFTPGARERLRGTQPGSNY